MEMFELLKIQFNKVRIVFHSLFPAGARVQNMKQIIKWMLDQGTRERKLIKTGNIGVSRGGKRRCHKSSPAGTLLLILIRSAPASELLASAGDCKPGTCATRLPDLWPSHIINTSAARGGRDTGFISHSAPLVLMCLQNKRQKIKNDLFQLSVNNPVNMWHSAHILIS